MCRRLRVVDELGKTVAILGKKSSDSGRVRILEIFNSSLNSVFLVGHNPNKDGVVYIVGDGFLSGAEHRGVYLGVDDKGGVVQVSRNDGPTAQMSIAEYGGAIAVFNNAGKNVGYFGVTNRGHGALQTKTNSVILRRKSLKNFHVPYRYDFVLGLCGIPIALRHE